MWYKPGCSSVVGVCLALSASVTAPGRRAATDVKASCAGRPRYAAHVVYSQASYP
ncbi:MAG: hypothetical protein FWG74_04750 [Planctomycetes bacterium]|nr:hypothetical protein [Planctomycetota bacterium]